MTTTEHNAHSLPVLPVADVERVSFDRYVAHPGAGIAGDSYYGPDGLEFVPAEPSHAINYAVRVTRSADIDYASVDAATAEQGA